MSIRSHFLVIKCLVQDKTFLSRLYNNWMVQTLYSTICIMYCINNLQPNQSKVVETIQIDNQRYTRIVLVDTNLPSQISRTTLRPHPQ